MKQIPWHRARTHSCLRNGSDYDYSPLSWFNFWFFHKEEPIPLFSIQTSLGREIL